MARCALCHRRVRRGDRCPVDGAPANGASEGGRAADAGAGEVTIPGYQVGAQIAAGGFAHVLGARRQSDGTAAAIKVARSNDSVTLARFQREIAASTAAGPTVAPAVYGSGALADGRPFLAMQRLEGEPLAARLESLPAPPDPAWIAGAADGMLECLAAVHRGGWIHRDVKPENLFLLPGAGVRLIDFGLARRPRAAAGERAHDEADTAVVGTTDYMSPEQLRAAPDVDARSDLYSFAVVLYELFTLRTPFGGSRSSIEHGHLMLVPPRPGELAAVPHAVEEVLLACLAKDPARRPPDAEALRGALARAFHSYRSTPQPISRRPRGAPSDERRPVALLYAQAGGAAPEVAAAAGPAARMIRQRRDRFVFAFTGAQHEDPVHSAVAAARALVQRAGARCAVQLTVAVAREGDGGVPLLYGAAIERPETWIPGRPWDGLVLTAGAAHAFASAAPDPEAPGFYRPTAGAIGGGGHPLEPCVGREEVEATLADSLAAALHRHEPTLFTLVGDRGLGKTRLLAEAEAAARRLADPVAIIHVVARHPAARGGPRDEPLAQLLRGVVGGDRDGREVREDRRAEARAAADRLRELAHGRPVVVLVDDAHWCDDPALDALEGATRAGEPLRLWIGVAAMPDLLAVRRTWGLRAARHDVVKLAPLAEAATLSLLERLLARVKNAPAEALRRLAAWCAGNPSLAVELVRTLEREGIVRPHGGGEAWYLAAAELDRLPAVPSGGWLAARELESLPPVLAALARLCAVLGPGVTLDEVEGVQRAAQAAGTLGPEIVDPATGLHELVRRGLLAATSRDRHDFRVAVIRQAIYEQTDEETRRRLHDHAYAWWRSGGTASGVERLHRLAVHGARSGRPREAMSSYLALAAAARGRNAFSEAESMYTSALELIDPADPADAPSRIRILEGRGGVRKLLTHYEEGAADFSAARRIAEDSRDREAAVRLLLAEGATCDFMERFEESARLIEQAAELSGSSAMADAPVATRARLANWLGVVRHRQGRYEEAIALLTTASALGEALGDQETQVGSQLMLAAALRKTGRTADGEGLIDATIALCERTSDFFHLAIGLCNRINFRRQRRDSARAVEDLQRAIAIAHEMGYDETEMYGRVELAQLQFAEGDLAGALDSSARAHLLGKQRFRGHSLVGGLSYANMLAHAGRLDDARAVLAVLPAEEVGTAPWCALPLAGLRLAVGQDDGAAGADAWDSLLDRARAQLPPGELVELLWLRGLTAARRGDPATARAALDEARRTAQALDSPMVRGIDRDLAALSGA